MITTYGVCTNISEYGGVNVYVCIREVKKKTKTKRYVLKGEVYFINTYWQARLQTGSDRRLLDLRTGPKYLSAIICLADCVRLPLQHHVYCYYYVHIDILPRITQVIFCATCVERQRATFTTLTVISNAKTTRPAHQIPHSLSLSLRYNPKPSPQPAIILRHRLLLIIMNE